MAISKNAARLRRKAGLRRRVAGTTERPRLSVFRSLRHIRAQVVDDVQCKVLAATGTDSKGLVGDLSGLNKIDQAKRVGAQVAQLCQEQGIKKVVFDRGGYKYHGRVAALAAAARESGLDF